jgi:hypothetical protein
MRIVRTIGFALILSVLAARGPGVSTQAPAAQGSPSSTRFQIEGASIGDVHRAIQRGQITCRGVVEAYLERAQAYNGSCNQLVTEDNVSGYLPNSDEYKTAVAATASLPAGASMLPARK